MIWHANNMLSVYKYEMWEQECLQSFQFILFIHLNNMLKYMYMYSLCNTNDICEFD